VQLLPFSRAGRAGLVAVLQMADLITWEKEEKKKQATWKTPTGTA